MVEIEDIVRKHRSRKRHAQLIDESLQAQKAYGGLDKAGQEKWLRVPNRQDVVGVDTSRPILGVDKRKLKPVKIGPFKRTDRKVFPIVAHHRGGKQMASDEYIQNIRNYTDENFPKEKGNLKVKKIEVADSIMGERGASGWFRKEGSQGVIAIHKRHPTKEDKMETILHEFVHARKAYDKKAKLPRNAERDREEKETTLESIARLGTKKLGKSKQSGYYFHTGKRYPKVAGTDQRKLGTASKHGRQDTRTIERMIDKNIKKTDLDQVRIAHGPVGDAGRVKSFRPGAETIDEHYTTSEGEIWHFYKPRGTSGVLDTAKFIDKWDHKTGEETVWKHSDKGKRPIIKPVKVHKYQAKGKRPTPKHRRRKPRPRRKGRQ